MEASQCSFDMIMAAGQHTADHQHTTRCNHSLQMRRQLDQRRGEDVGQHHMERALHIGQRSVRHRHSTAHTIAFGIGQRGGHRCRGDVDGLHLCGTER